jgi:hypothetical protein
MPGRRRTPRLGDVFGCTFLFVLSFSLVLGNNTATCFSLAHALRVLWMVDPSLFVRPCFRWSNLVCSFDPSLVNLVRPWFGWSTLLYSFDPYLVDIVRPGLVGRPSFTRSTLQLADLVRPYFRWSTSCTRSTLIWLVHPPLLVRPLFGRPRSTLFSLGHLSMDHSHPAKVKRR